MFTVSVNLCVWLLTLIELLSWLFWWSCFHLRYLWSSFLCVSLALFLYTVFSCFTMQHVQFLFSHWLPCDGRDFNVVKLPAWRRFCRRKRQPWQWKMKYSFQAFTSIRPQCITYIAVYNNLHWYCRISFIISSDGARLQPLALHCVTDHILANQEPPHRWWPTPKQKLNGAKQAWTRAETRSQMLCTPPHARNAGLSSKRLACKMGFSALRPIDYSTFQKKRSYLFCQAPRKGSVAKH